MNTFIFGGQSILDDKVLKKIYLNENFENIINRISLTVNIDLTRAILEKNINKKQLEKQLIILAIQTFQFEFLHELGIIEDEVFGYSIGDFAALVCCNILSVEDVAKIIVKRFEISQKFFPRSLSGNIEMLSIQNLHISVVSNMIKNFSNIDITNINTEKQCVVCGRKEELFNLKRSIKSQYNSVLIIPIMVNVPFHTNHLSVAAKEFEKYLHNFDFLPSNTIPNLSGHSILKKDDYYTILAQIMCNCVNWNSSVKEIEKENNNIYECSIRKMLIKFNNEILTDEKKHINQTYFFDLYNE